MDGLQIAETESARQVDALAAMRRRAERAEARAKADASAAKSQRRRAENAEALVKTLTAPPPVFSPIEARHFSIIAELAAIALRLERRDVKGGSACRQAVGRLRNLLAGDIDPLIPVEQLAADKAERRRRAALLTAALAAADPAAQALQAKQAEDRDGGTPETWRKRGRGNPIQRMVESGRIGALELAAAREIQIVAENQLAGACCAIIDPTAIMVDTSPRPRTEVPSSIDTLPGFRRFTVWCRHARQVGRPLEAILRVVAECRSVREVETMSEMRNGSLADIVVDSLRDYTILAGWSEKTLGLAVEA